MGRKELECLVGKLCSMHLEMPGAVAHLYYIQRALTQGGKDRAWLLAEFHWEIYDWSALVAQKVAQPMHLAEIVRREPNHVGLCDAYEIKVGGGGVWLNTSGSGTSLVWRHPWPPGIIAALISDRNPEWTLTNSDLEIAALVLHKSTLLKICPETTIAAPRLGSENTPTVSWSTREALTTNPVFADLLCIRALHSRQFFLNPLVF